MEIEKEELLRVLNSVMLNTSDLIDQIIKYDTEINDKDISANWISPLLPE